MGSILRLRDVRLIVGAVGLSAVGDTVLWVLLALHVGEETGSAIATSAVFICLWGPVVALGGVAGRIVDRHENRRLLIGVSLGQAAVVAAMAGATGSLPVLLGLCVLLGAGVAVELPRRVRADPGRGRRGAGRRGQRARRGRALPRDDRRPADRRRARRRRPHPLGLLLDAASFLAVAAAGLALHARRAPAAARTRARARAAAAPGGRRSRATARSRSRWPRRSPRCCSSRSRSSAEVFFATDVLHAGAAGFGLLMSAWTLGMVGGAVGLARLVPKRWLAAGALLGVALQGAGLLGAAVGATMALALAGFLVGGAAHGTKNVLLRTLIHESVPDAFRGRVFAGYNAARNGAELGALAAGGVVVGLAGSQVALALSGALPLTIAVAALGLILLRRAAPAELAAAVPRSA